MFQPITTFLKKLKLRPNSYKEILASIENDVRGLLVTKYHDIMPVVPNENIASMLGKTVPYLKHVSGRNILKSDLKDIGISVSVGVLGVETVVAFYSDELCDDLLTKEI